MLGNSFDAEIIGGAADRNDQGVVSEIAAWDKLHAIFINRRRQ